MAIADLQDADRTARPLLIEGRKRDKERPQPLGPDEPGRIGGMAGRNRRGCVYQQKRCGADQRHAAASPHRRLAAEVANIPMIFSAITS